MAQAETTREPESRPLSPHLSVYKPMLTTAMSMAHRVSGVALYIGAALFALYFLSLALGSGVFSVSSWIASGFVGRVIVVGFVWALYHHLLGGVRHALWDRGLFMDPVGRERLALGTLVGGVVLTAATFIVSALAG
ncbi:MAG TPA: succinate dehydrogenase, cytochrome b556 subunit [Methylocystis sp.]|nr:succinate dehydrogenase, cytochrome b556 subunit [Methylocystis sp.]